MQRSSGTHDAPPTNKRYFYLDKDGYFYNDRVKEEEDKASEEIVS